MRQTSELLKIITDSDQSEQPLNDAEENENVSLIADEKTLEPRAFTQLKPLFEPVREVELSLVRSDPHLVTLSDVAPEASSQYLGLATGLIVGAMKHPPLKRVLITSAHHCEGRTCVILNLAIALARARQRVLVVDSDLMRPSVNRLLGIDTEIGLAEALANGMPPAAAVIRISPIGFDVLPTRAQVENSAELLASPEFKAMLAALDSNYDYILFDSAPLLASADASLLVIHTHVTLMVMRPGTTT
ncbi:MAG: CpsD/CapB family tyrosine-protein kinase, partial [Acidobacteria bacterium]|nr:CpsD/CapB family tyrosine-protein kinase [Acidobacteriota bacterium]